MLLYPLWVRPEGGGVSTDAHYVPSALLRDIDLVVPGLDVDYLEAVLIEDGVGWEEVGGFSVR